MRTETSHQQETAQWRLRKVVITSLCFVRFWKKERKINFAPSQMNADSLRIAGCLRITFTLRTHHNLWISIDSPSKSLLFSSLSESAIRTSVTAHRVFTLLQGSVCGCVFNHSGIMNQSYYLCKLYIILLKNHLQNFGSCTGHKSWFLLLNWPSST